MARPAAGFVAAPPDVTGMRPPIYFPFTINDAAIFEERVLSTHMCFALIPCLTTVGPVVQLKQG